ncbi:MAG: hypothetical protein KatS3mg117_1779 [Geminicoccaceae bacterium]|nr:MAG: hypothetical protein KatS3mg117_1779 [Geminicoccaceae bacterium]
MTGRIGGTPLALAAALLAHGIVVGAGSVVAQQAAPGGPPPTTEQLRQAIEEIKKRLARPGEGQAPTESPLAAELKAANARITELTAQLAKLRGERDGLAAELATAREEAQRLEQAVRELDGKAQSLEQRLAELDRSRERELDQLRAELAQARQQAEAATQAASGGQERVRTLEAELEQARREVAARETELATVRARADRESRRLAERENELAGLVSRLGEVQSELETLRGKARSEAEAQAKRIEELTARLATADATAARLEGELGELRAIAAASVGELQNLGEQLLRVLADNQALAQALEQARTARELALAEAAAARRDAELYAAQLAQLRGQPNAGERRPEVIEPAAAPATGPAAPVDGLAAPEPAPEPLSRAQLAELRATEGPNGTIVTVIEGTAFQFGTEQFTDAANGALLRVGRLIELVRPERVRFVGHTDSQGDEGVNRRLSQRRAQAVRDWLVRNRGLDPARTRVEGRGPDQPVASNDTPEGRRANRRVEVILEPATRAR